MITRKELIRISLFFLCWRGALFLLGAAAPFFLKFQPSFPYYEILPIYGQPLWLNSWANFDGVHYLTIAQNGYLGTGLIQAFFPLFPYVMLHSAKLFFEHFQNSLLLGLLLSNVFAWILFMVWFGFVKSQSSARRAWQALLVLALFPTAFFFGALYTESLFLLLVIGAFWSARQKRWMWAGVLAALASATRLVGIFLVPALLLELWLQRRALPWRETLCVLFGSLGLLGYMVYLERVFHDPLYFVHVQAAFGGGRQSSMVPYPQVVWRSLRILLTNQLQSLRYLTYVQEFLSGTVVFATLLLNSLRIRSSYLLFAVGAFLLPTMTGTFSSMSRYILVCFPLYLIVAEFLDNKPSWRPVWYVISLMLLIVNTIMFIQGYWVA